MQKFSTVLFVDGQPVGYLVHEDEDRLVMSPAEAPDRQLLAPVIYVLEKDGQFVVEGTSNEELKQQVLDEVSNVLIIPNSSLSAAP